MTVPFHEAQKMFGSSVLLDSKRHAEEEFPKESVGFVVNDKYIRVNNTHKDPENHFRVHGRTIKKYAGNIQAVIHSHNISVINPKTGETKHSLYPSYEDQIAQISWNIPFGIQYVTNEGAGNILWFGNGVPIADYSGRPYIHAVYDCFTIIKDYYNEELKIKIKDFPHRNQWWDKGEDLYVDNIMAYGFEKVELKDMQTNDIVLLSIRSKVANHAVIYLGGDQCLHHLALATSKQESINRYIDPQKTFFHSVWRYKK